MPNSRPCVRHTLKILYSFGITVRCRTVDDRIGGYEIVESPNSLLQIHTHTQDDPYSSYASVLMILWVSHIHTVSLYIPTTTLHPSPLPSPLAINQFHQPNQKSSTITTTTTTTNPHMEPLLTAKLRRISSPPPTPTATAPAPPLNPTPPPRTVTWVLRASRRTKTLVPEERYSTSHAIAPTPAPTAPEPAPTPLVVLEALSELVGRFLEFQRPCVCICVCVCICESFPLGVCVDWTES